MRHFSMEPKPSTIGLIKKTVLVVFALTMGASVAVYSINLHLRNRERDQYLQMLDRSDRVVHEQFLKLCEITKKFEEDQNTVLPEIDRRCLKQKL